MCPGVGEDRAYAPGVCKEGPMLLGWARMDTCPRVGGTSMSSHRQSTHMWMCLCVGVSTQACIFWLFAQEGLDTGRPQYQRKHRVQVSVPDIPLQ